MLKYLYQTQTLLHKSKRKKVQTSTLDGKISKYKDENPGSMRLGLDGQSQQEGSSWRALDGHCDMSENSFLLGPLHVAYILSVIKTKGSQRSENRS